MANLKLIEAKTLGSNTANVTFTSIPQTYTDLKLVYSARNTTSVAGEGFDATLSFNGTTANRLTRVLRGDGSIVSVNTISDPTDFRLLRSIQPSDYTSSVFSNVEIYIPNYTSSNYKSFSVDTVLENNATATGMGFIAGLWSDTAAITSITLGGFGGNLLSGSTFYLYGISNVTTGSKATGGIVSYDSSYYYHMFPYSGTFTPTQSLTVDYLVVAGGGSGGSQYYGGGGGAGGYRTATSQSLTAQNYTVTVGAGGAGVGPGTYQGNNGGNSSFNSFSATGGGGGGISGIGNGNTQGSTGGSGGGAGAKVQSLSTLTSAGNAGGYSPVEGYGGGSANSTDSDSAGGGGGGAGGAGGNATGTGSSGGAGVGGVGSNSVSSWATATQTGANNGYYAGGGGGAGWNGAGGKGGSGGGGNGSSASIAAVSGTANTGSGGGGGNSSAASGSGGSGLVIIRYAI